MYLWCDNNEVLAYIFSFCVVLVSATVAKTSTFFMIKQIALQPSNIPFCNEGRKGWKDWKC